MHSPISYTGELWSPIQLAPPLAAQGPGCSAELGSSSHHRFSFKEEKSLSQSQTIQ